MLDKLTKLGRLPPVDINEFVLHPIWGCEQISKFNRGWRDYLQNERSAFVVRYEDLKEDPLLWFTRLFDFLGHKNYDLDRLIAESSFQKMRMVELQGADKKLKLYGLKDADYDSLKVRKGAVKRVRRISPRLKPLLPHLSSLRNMDSTFSRYAPPTRLLGTRGDLDFEA